MEKLFLGSIPLGQVMDVVDHQQVVIPKSMPERTHITTLYGFKKLVHECVAGCVVDAHVRVIAHGLLANSLQKMGLTKSNTAMHKEWVVGTTWLLRDSRGSGVGESVIWSNHKRLECVVG